MLLGAVEVPSDGVVVSGIVEDLSTLVTLSGMFVVSKVVEPLGVVVVPKGL